MTAGGGIRIGTYLYEYALREHSGSTRVLLRDRYFDGRDDGTEVVGGDFVRVPRLRILQTHGDFPIGLAHETQVSSLEKGRDSRVTIQVSQPS